MAVNESLSDYVAGEIRASLARQRTSGRELAQKLGVSRSWVSYRLTGTTEITLNDLQRISEALGIDIADLLPQPAYRDDRGVGPGRRTNAPLSHHTDRPRAERPMAAQISHTRDIPQQAHPGPSPRPTRTPTRRPHVQTCTRGGTT